MVRLKGEKTLIVDSFHPSREIIEQAVQTVRRGGLVLHPTDTVYGLACDPFCQSAVERVLTLKKRSSRQGFLLLIPEMGWAQRLAEQLPTTFLPFSRQFWPGAVTFLLWAGDRVPDLIRGREGKVGLRLPRLPFLRTWLQALDSPLVSTSANLSGQSSPSLEELRQRFQPEVDLFLEEQRTSNGRPSTVVDLTIEPPQVVRRGRRGDELEQFLKELSA